MLATLEDLYKFREEVDRTLQMQGLDVWRTLKSKIREKEHQVYQAISAAQHLKQQLELEKEENDQNIYKMQKDFAKQRAEKRQQEEQLLNLQQENERIKERLGERDEQVSQLVKEKEELTKQHLREIGEVRLTHEQELFMLRRLKRK